MNRPSTPFAFAVRTAGFGLVVYTFARVAAALLSSASMAAVVAQAVIAEWGLGRVGVTWSDPEAPMPTTTALARRALVGAAIGTGLAAVLLAVLAVTRGALFERADGAVAPMVIGLLTAGFLAMRDELLLHGLVLRVLTSVDAVAPRVIACALTSAAAASAEPGATVRTVAVAALLGVVFGALWVRDRGAWQAWGAHAAFAFVTGPLAQGGLVDARVATNVWGGGDSGMLGGAAAMVALAPAALVSLLWAARGRRGESDSARPR